MSGLFLILFEIILNEKSLIPGKSYQTMAAKSDKGKKTPAPKSSSEKPEKAKGDDEEEDDDEEGEDEVDDWEKPEEEENWDPDFEEFDMPKSKVKKTGGGATAGKKAGKGEEEDDAGVDDEFKDMDLFNDSGYDEEDDDF